MHFFHYITLKSFVYHTCIVFPGSFSIQYSSINVRLIWISKIYRFHNILLFVYRIREDDDIKVRFHKTLHFLQPVIFDSHVSLARHLVRTWLQSYDGTATQKGDYSERTLFIRSEKKSVALFSSLWQNLSRHLIGSLYPMTFTAVIGRTFQISKFKFKF